MLICKCKGRAHATVHFAAAHRKSRGISFCRILDHCKAVGRFFAFPAGHQANRSRACVTLEAELNKDAPVRTAKLSVDYDEVEIGGKNYICPVHGIAVSTVYDVEMEQLDGVGLERFINVVRFTDYHKFGSTARILTTTEP
jgi:hypothetical protein